MIMYTGIKAGNMHIYGSKMWQPVVLFLMTYQDPYAPCISNVAQIFKFKQAPLFQFCPGM